MFLNQVTKALKNGCPKFKKDETFDHCSQLVIWLYVEWTTFKKNGGHSCDKFCAWLEVGEMTYSLKLWGRKIYTLDPDLDIGSQVPFNPNLELGRHSINMQHIFYWKSI